MSIATILALVFYGWAGLWLALLLYQENNEKGWIAALAGALWFVVLPTMVGLVWASKKRGFHG